jgi:hypothetical protein
MKTPLFKSNLLIKPSIVRVGCSAFLVLAAAVLTAASLLAPFARAQVESCDKPSSGTVPVKIVNIKNNSGVPIYVVLETAKQDLLDQNNRQHDRWLQAEFNDLVGTYASTYIYRAYVNPQNGITNGKSVSVKIPFYTQLESTPDPKKPDQYIDWWRALRIHVYNDPGAITNAYKTDTNSANAVKISAPSGASVPTCPACFAPLVVYRDQRGEDEHGLSLPSIDPSQLLEFTFAIVPEFDPAFPKALKIDHGFVDYDISSVDQVYLPVAMDPVNNPFIGWIGSVLGQGVFHDRLDSFQKDFKWPKYKWPDYVTNKDNIRLPGSFNVMNEIAHPGAPPPFEPSGAAIKDLAVVQKMEKLWDECCGADWPSKPCQKPSASSNTCDTATAAKMGQVAELFEKNYKRYTELCGPSILLTRDQMMANVYGWVPFKTKSCGGVELNKTPGIGGEAGYRKIQKAYVELQYKSPPNLTGFGDFNRYVELIHDAKYLHSGEYAFSIDDAAGNMLEVGDGINITVGGVDGLGNTNPYDPWRFFLFNAGAARETGPVWTKYRVCTALDGENCSSLPPDRCMKESDRSKGFIGYAGIKIGAVECPCVIVLQDSNGSLYKTKVERLPEPPQKHDLDKEGDPPPLGPDGLPLKDDRWIQKTDGSFTNVACADTETSFDWCRNLNANVTFADETQRWVYHVNTSAPVVFKPGIKFENGPLEATLEPDRLSVQVKWPKAITQPPGGEVEYQLTLWDRENCPGVEVPCNGKAYIPVPACDSSKTECAVVFSTLGRPSPNAPELTAHNLKSISVVAIYKGKGVEARKQANFPTGH